MTLNDAPKPEARGTDWVVQALFQLLAYRLELCLKAISPRFAVNQETSLTAHPTDVRKAQEVEGLGFAEAPLPVLRMGEPAKANQPGLVGVDCQTEFLKTRFNLLAEATGIVWVLEPHDDVIGIPYHHDYPPGLALAPLLHPEIEDVQTKQALWHLYRQSLIHRETFGGVIVYFAREARERHRQSVARRQMLAGEFERVSEGVLAHELKAAIILFFSLLDERQRRFFAGLESLKIGQGGDARIAHLLGVDPHTVAKGRRELLQRDIVVDGVRKRGGGRPSTKKNPANHRPHRRTAARRGSRGSDEWFALDPKDYREDCRAIDLSRYRGQSQHGGASVERDGVLPQDEP